MASINSTTIRTSRPQVPGIARQVNFNQARVLNFGAGKYPQLFSEFAKGRKAMTVTNYDPNLDDAMLDSLTTKMPADCKVTRDLPNGSYSVVVVANVLNVLDSRPLTTQVLTQIKAVAKGAEIFISIYEGDGAGRGCATKDGYQQNKKAVCYQSVIESVIDTHTFIRRGTNFHGVEKE